MKLLSTGSYSPYFENRKLVRGCTPEVIPYLLTGSKSGLETRYCEQGVETRSYSVVGNQI